MRLQLELSPPGARRISVPRFVARRNAYRRNAKRGHCILLPLRVASVVAGALAPLPTLVAGALAPFPTFQVNVRATVPHHSAGAQLSCSCSAAQYSYSYSAPRYSCSYSTRPSATASVRRTIRAKRLPTILLPLPAASVVAGALAPLPTLVAGALAPFPTFQINARATVPHHSAGAQFSCSCPAPRYSCSYSMQSPATASVRCIVRAKRGFPLPNVLC